MGRWVLLTVLCVGLCPVLGIAGDEGWEAEAAKIHTADCNPVDVKAFELFLGFEPASARSSWDGEGQKWDRGGKTTENHFVLGLTYGLVKDLDLGVSCGYDAGKDRAEDVKTLGFDDIALAARWKFLSKETLGLAFLPSLILPTGSEDGEDHLGTTQLFYSAGLGVVAVRSWKRATLNLDAGYSVPFGGDRGEARGSFAGNLGFGWQPLAWLQPEVEINYGFDTVADAEGSRSLAATFGVLIPTEKWGRFQLGVQPTLWGRWADRSTGYHFAWVKGLP